MNTLYSIFCTEGEEIEIGNEYFLSQLWDGQFGDVEEILDSGCVSPDNENVVAFDIIERNGMDSLVLVKDMY